MTKTTTRKIQAVTRRALQWVNAQGETGASLAGSGYGFGPFASATGLAMMRRFVAKGWVTESDVFHSRTGDFLYKSMVFFITPEGARVSKAQPAPDPTEFYTPEPEETTTAWLLALLLKSGRV